MRHHMIVMGYERSDHHLTLSLYLSKGARDQLDRRATFSLEASLFRSRERRWCWMYHCASILVLFWDKCPHRCHGYRRSGSCLRRLLLPKWNDWSSFASLAPFGFIGDVVLSSSVIMKSRAFFLFRLFWGFRIWTIFAGTVTHDFRWFCSKMVCLIIFWSPLLVVWRIDRFSPYYTNRGIDIDNGCTQVLNKFDVLSYLRLCVPMFPLY